MCYGTYTFPDGTKYVGQYRDDKRNGQGTYTFADGRKYVGEFRDDKRDGQGSLFSPDGPLIQNGIWLNGDFVQANNLPNPVLTAQRP